MSSHRSRLRHLALLLASLCLPGSLHAAYGVLVDDKLELKGSARIADVSDSLRVASNNTGREKVKLEGSARIDGDLYIGPGGSASQVVKLKGAARIAGSVRNLSSRVDIPDVSIPSLGSRQSDIKLKNGSRTLTGDLRIKDLELKGSAELVISGDVRIHIENDLEIEGGAEMRLADGATLELYIADDLELKGSGDLNADGAPGRVKIWLSRSEKIELEGSSRVSAAIIAPDAELKMKGSALLRGSFMGKKAKLEGSSLIRLDGSGGGSSGGGNSQLDPIASWHFEEPSWGGTLGEILDASGNDRHGRLLSNASPVTSSPALSGNPGSCGYASLDRGALSLPNLPVSTAAGAKTSVAFWMRWHGVDNMMPIGWGLHDLWFYGGSFGFNSSNGDIYGISTSGLANRWVHVVAEFTNGNLLANKLYIDGRLQSLSQRRRSPNNRRAVVQSELRAGGWTYNSSYRFDGDIDELQVFNGALGTAQIAALMAERHACADASSCSLIDENLTEVFSDDFNDGNFNGWTNQQLQPRACGWQVSNGELHERSNNCNAFLTHDLSNDGISPASTTEYAISATVKPFASSSMNNGVGFVFGWQDNSNYYLLRWNDYGDRYRGYSDYRDFELLRINNGRETLLSRREGVNLPAEFKLTLRVDPGNGIRVNVDCDSSSYTLAAAAHAPAIHRFGLYSWDNDSGVFYDDIKVYARANTKPIADWRMDEAGWDGTRDEVVDSSGNALHGTGVGDIDTDDGKLCRAGDYTRDQYVSVPDDAKLRPAAITVAAWVKPESLAHHWGSVVMKSSSGSWTDGYGLAHYNRPNDIRFFVNHWSRFNVGTTVVPNVWSHVVGSYDGNALKIYVNGTLRGTTRVTGAINHSRAPLLIGKGAGSRSYRWEGGIDEVQLYDRALGVDEIESLYKNQLNGRNTDGSERECPISGPDRFRVNHDGSGIHCSAEPVTVSALDSSGNLIGDHSGSVVLNTGSGRGNWSRNGAYGTLTALGSGRARYAFDPRDGGIARLALNYSQGGEALDIDACDGAICDDDSEGTLTFAASGFTVTASALSNPPPAVIDNSFAAQTAGRSFDLHVTAYGTTPTDPSCGVIESYNGSRSLALWVDHINPGSGPRTPLANDNAIAANEGAATGQPISFSNGQAQISMRYKDVGKIRIGLRDAADSSRRGGTSGFVVRPAQLAVTATNAGGSNNPQAADAGGSVFTSAGSSFTLRVDALDSDGDRTPSFGLESPAETLRHSHSLLAPSGGNNGVLAGALLRSADGRFSGDFSFNEVGIINLDVAVADGDYLGSGPLSAASQRLGRFTPHHLRVENLDHGALANSCSAGGFSYTGQAIEFASGARPNFTISGRSAGDAITQNYRGSFAPLTTASVTLPAISSDSLQPGADGSTLVAIQHTQAAPAFSDNGNGTHRYSLGGDRFTWRREANSLVGAFNGTPDLVVSSVRDGDGVAAQIDSGNPPTLRPRGVSIRYGRLSLGSAHGSEQLPLTLPLRAEIYDSSSGSFIAHSSDSCTSGLSLSIADVDASDALDASSLSASIAQPATAGAMDISIAAPGSIGSARLTVDAPSWLEFDWGQPESPEPAATATFGIYSGNPSLIYMQEVR